MASYESFAAVYDRFMDQTPYDQWKENICSLFRQYNVTEHGQVVDLGCGTGKMTRRIGEAGYEMIGIDGSEDMLEIAKNTKNDDILYVLQDMRDIQLLEKADAMISICDCMNYMLDFDDLVQVFFGMRTYLKKDGIGIFDMNTRFKYETMLCENTFAENREDCSFIWENFYDPEDQINEYQLTLFIQNKNQCFDKYEELHFQRAYSMEEVKKAIQMSGLELKSILDVDTMKEPNKNSERLYYIVSNER
ncbi:MAG: class I SAM-dependent methyltransferase [Anaerostipes sp.]|nr:class I SAM-dependent methyltransferase [Anaerostipes sp.]